MMKIVVCVKVVKGEINPFDECALECALKIKDARITVLSMGAEPAKPALDRISRLAVDRIILLSDRRLAGSDTLATSYALSQVIKQIKPELVLCGRQSIDGDTAQVGPCLSELLGYNLITNIMEMEIDKKICCKTRMGYEQTDFPAVLTVERINTLRFPRIGSNIKNVEIISADDAEIDTSKCGLSGSPTKVLKSFESRRGTRKCQFITPDKLDWCITEALKKVHEEIKPQTAGQKLETITVIGDELAETARELARNVRVIQSRDYIEIAELVKNDEVVLWSADLWGRKNAPRTAVILKTGLCADCTALETDGERLFMYRPAFGGTLTAKIECKTRPQMATVRTENVDKSDVVFGLGRGAANNLEKYLSLAQKYNADIAASRAFVDMGLADYDRQVGLTGKIIAPKVYVACGISGAVQHTCGFENAGTVIAINPDKNARIFDFADFGIVTDDIFLPKSGRITLG